MKTALRYEVETSTSFLDLYNRLNHFLSDLDPEARLGLRRDPKTQAFRAQLSDSLQALTVPSMTLGLKHALCAIVDQCEDDEEELQLCSAMLQHIGGEVEMYVRAVEVDPDQRRYHTLTLGEGA